MLKLTIKQKAFCEAYLKNGGNATQAALTAGYSKKTAYAIGLENLKKPVIADYIGKRQLEVEKKLEIGADDALNRLIDIWRATPQISTSKQIDHLRKNKVIKKMTYEYTPDLDSQIKALDLYLKYKSLLSQAQLEKARIEIKLMQAKLAKINELTSEKTEDRLEELMNLIKEEVNDS